MSDVVLERIAGWEAAGLIDAATAERLRAQEAASAPDERPASPETRQSFVASFFGPTVSIVEAFSYLGGAFVLAAWGALFARLSNEAAGTTREWLLVAGLAVPAVIFFVIGLALHGRTPRLDRAAGVAFVLSVAFVWGGVTLNIEIFTDGALPPLVGVAAAFVVALAYRWFHPSVLTEIALLATLTGLVGASLGLLNQTLFPSDFTTGVVPNRPLWSTAVEAAAWVGCAIVIGLIGLLDARSPGAAAGRRATVARFWAGVVAVVGVAYAVMRTDFDFAGSHRVIEPWVADVIVLIVAGILLERAFRRESGAYVLAAALGVVIALTDFNFSYFAQASGTEVALLVEGLLLIAIAFAAERISRRVGGSEPEDPAGEGPEIEPVPRDSTAVSEADRETAPG